jgi:outer membrane protein assembly factor BamB
MKSAIRLSLAGAVLLVMVIVAALAADWPAFRGSHGGVSKEKDLPVEWTKDNFLWKTKLPGPGSSSPIVLGDKLFLTCYTGYGTGITKGFKDKGVFGFSDAGGDQKKLRLHLLCVDRKTGKITWNKEIEPKLPEFPFKGFIREHGYASSTPVTDGKNVYVFFGKTGVLAFDLDGKQLWQTSVGDKTDEWGSASSPILFGNKVIVNASIESNSLVALDQKTGDKVWSVKINGKCWGSPVMVKTADGKHEVVLSLPGQVVGFDPEKGTELWQCEGIQGGVFGQAYTMSTPVVRRGIIYVVGGGGPVPKKSLAIKPGGRGNVTKTHVLWQQKAGTGIPSPVLDGDYVVFVDGNAVALNTADGKVAANERLYTSGGEYCSPILAGDKIFVLTRFDGVYVTSFDGKFHKLAHNTFDGDDSIFNSSPAISDGRMYIRSNAYLYCIGNKSEK